MKEAIEVVICSELTTFAVESPTLPTERRIALGCDLLRINYLCGRITNFCLADVCKILVVICSELTTFAVESPTLFVIIPTPPRCDLLRINYLCGRITNSRASSAAVWSVVICSELTTFAVESPTFKSAVGAITSCDLLRINYLCGRITNPTFVVPLVKWL